MSKGVKSRIRFGGYTPDNLLGFLEGVNHNKFMWRTDECVKHLIFDGKNKIKTDAYYVPNLIWIFENELKLYAYKEWKGLETKLYKAPFFNTSNTVCLGQANEFLAKLLGKCNSFSSIINAVEMAFYDSTFSTNYETQIKGSYVDMYSKSKNAFPYQFLISTNKILKTIIHEEFHTS